MKIYSPNDGQEMFTSSATIIITLHNGSKFTLYEGAADLTLSVTDREQLIVTLLSGNAIKVENEEK